MNWVTHASIVKINKIYIKLFNIIIHNTNYLINLFFKDQFVIKIKTYKIYASFTYYIIFDFYFLI